MTRAELTWKHGTRFCRYVLCSMAQVILHSAKTADTINRFRVYEALQTVSSLHSQGYCEIRLNSFKQRKWVSIQGAWINLIHGNRTSTFASLNQEFIVKFWYIFMKCDSWWWCWRIKLDNNYSVLQVNDILLPLWQCQNNEGQPQVSADPVPHEIQEMWVCIYIYTFIVRPIPKGYHKKRI